MVTESLSPEEAERYRRHLVLPEVGPEGQRRLKRAGVLCVGAGGLGSPVALYLAAAGVGRLGLIDFDEVEVSNLQRQVVHGTSDIGRAKIASAGDRLREINPLVQVEGHAVRLDADNARAILAPYDVIVDGSDTFATRYLVNDACVLLGKPNVHGCVYRFEGQASVFRGPDGPCYRCLFPEPPAGDALPDCAEGGVLGVLPGLIGMIQATETLKLILGIGEPLVGRLLIYQALPMRFRELAVEKDPACPLCGTHPTITRLTETAGTCRTGRADLITAEALKDRLAQSGPVRLVDVREPHEAAICRIENSRLIPLDELAQRAGELDRGDDIVVYCHVGQRGEVAVRILKEAGFEHVHNLAGGILAWAARVDPSMTVY